MRRLAPALILLLMTVACGDREKIPLVPVDNRPLPFQQVVSVADPEATIQFLYGIHKLEQGAWRWTKRKFAIAFPVPADAASRGARLRAEFTVPAAMLEHTGGAMTLYAAVGGTALPQVTWRSPGEQVYEADLPASVLNRQSVAVEFTLNRFAQAGALDERELGLICRRFALPAR